jgi:hypothetical protein
VPPRLHPAGARPALVLLIALGACRSAVTADEPDPVADPSATQVVLGTRAGWRADLVLDLAGTGIWTVRSTQVFEEYGCPEIVGLDDLGRCHVLWSYSGKWTPATTVADGTWLGGLAQGDVDPRVPGRELYVGAKAGNVYEIVAHPRAHLDNRLVVNLENREVHTLLCADVLAAHPGQELLAFTSPGALYVLAPRADGLDGFEVLERHEPWGRVRDALLWTEAGGVPVIATAGRDGAIELLRWGASGPIHETVRRLPMGCGRLTRSVTAEGVLYSAADDGTVWRHECRSDGSWNTDRIYVGHPGPRGLAAGRFTADGSAETLVVFGYGKRVELLTRNDAGWTCETIFEDRDMGHWIAAAEVDGRNATDEIVLAGYGGRIVLLSREPGTGLPGTLIGALETGTP